MSIAAGCPVSDSRRDSHLRLEGPAVSGLQQIFIEDWDFAAGENLSRQNYFPAQRRDGPHHLQIIQSGPDSAIKGIREVYFSAILQARRTRLDPPRLISVARTAACSMPLNLAALSPGGVRCAALLGLYHPDKWIPYFAGPLLLGRCVAAAGVLSKVYQYTKGHAALQSSAGWGRRVAKGQ